MLEQEIPWDRQPPGLEPLASWLPIPQILWFAPLWRDIVGGLAPTVTGTVARAVSRGGVGASFQSGGILDFGDRFNEASFTNLLVFELPSLAATALSQSEYDNGASESLSSQYIDATAAGNIRLVRDGAAVVVETTAGGLIAAKREHWVIVSWDQNTGSGFIAIDGHIRAVATPGTQAWVTNGRYVLGRRRPVDLSATSDHIQYVHARWGRAFSQAEARRLTGGRYAELFAPRVEQVFEPPAAGGGAAEIGLATETDTALSLTAAQRLGVGQAQETDSALPLTSAQALAIGQALEQDTALPIGSSQTLAIGLAVEQDIAQPLGSGTVVAIGQAVESDIAQPLTAAQQLAIGFASETDTALPVDVVAGGVLGIALEQDIAQPLTAAQRLAIGQAQESDTALALLAGQGKAIGLALESDTALPVQALLGLGLAQEQDTALPLIAPPPPPPPPATESETTAGYRRNPRTPRELDPLPAEDLADQVRDKWDAIERANEALRRARRGPPPAAAVAPTQAPAPKPQKPGRASAAEPSAVAGGIGLQLTPEQLADEEAFILLVAELV